MTDKAPDLFDWIGPPEAEEKFATFHAAHPEVWGYFLQFAFQVIRRGYKNYGARDLLHRIRWETSVVEGGKPFKINNNWSPYYARMFHRTYPEHVGFFRNRKSRADDDAQEV